jgi:DGQHR domain-containing protein
MPDQKSPPMPARHPMTLVYMSVEEIMAIADIDRATRTSSGDLIGFQRHAIQDHISTIAAGLTQDGQGIPSPVMIAMMDDETSSLSPRGWLLDGQQRVLACLAARHREPIPVIIRAVKTHEELRTLFVTINNCRPLPSGLIAELLSHAHPLPPQLGDETMARLLVEQLNYDKNSPLCSMVKQQTNKCGIITDTALVRGIRTSLSHGALSVHMGQREAVMTTGLATLFSFYRALKSVFHSDMSGHTPKTSRLLHGAGIISTLHLMDIIYASCETDGQDDFRPTLMQIKPYCRWTSGTWDFGSGHVVPWNAIQNVPLHYNAISRHLELLARSPISNAKN